MMRKNWSEKQSSSLAGKWFTFKSRGYNLLMINATQAENKIILEYILEKEGDIEIVKASVPPNYEIPSVVEVFPQGEQMQHEITQRYPISFFPRRPKHPDSSVIEWGPFHPLLPEPVKFRLGLKDEVIESTCIETGYNYRGLEESCAGRKAEEVLEMLERTSVMNGFCMGLAFVHALEKMHGVDVPEKARWLRMFLMEMTYLHASLHSLSHTAQSLGLAACSARIFKLIGLYCEAAALISEHPQFSGVLEAGGLSRDITIETLYTVNAIIQEMEEDLKDIRDQWEGTPSIARRLKKNGIVDDRSARLMTGRAVRAAGISKDFRKDSVLPWSKLSYTIPQAAGSNCFARVMLMMEDALLSLELIDQIAEDMPHGDVKSPCRMDGSGEAIVREPEAYGTLALLVRQDEGRLQELKIRSAAALNFPFLPQCLEGTEIHDLPLVISTFELDLSSMEK